MMMMMHNLSVQLVASPGTSPIHNLSSRDTVKGFELFLIGQSFESEPHQDSPLIFQFGQLIRYWDCPKSTNNNRHNSCFDFP